MKKPNITPAPWQSNGKEEIFRWGNGPETKGYYPRIAKVSIWEDNKAMGSANAKAISAVPEMVDALIEAHEIISHKRKFEENSNMRKTLAYKEKVIVEALRKAGVTEL